MKDLLIITPVKDSLSTAEEAIAKVCASKQTYTYLVYNDFSLKENREKLEKSNGYELINIEDKVNTPPPNYRFTLCDAQKRALNMNAGLLIIESDVFIKENTISSLFEFAKKNTKCGMVAAITTDENKHINFPYKHIKPNGSDAILTSHRLSFCCTLLTLPLLQTLDFELLSDKKDWFDVQISRDSRKLGFENYVLPNVQVLHLPHSSRPWKKLKYTHPVKYYLRKWFSGKDKI